VYKRVLARHTKAVRADVSVLEHLVVPVKGSEGGVHFMKGKSGVQGAAGKVAEIE
jgi:hypothetical protein